MPSKKKEENNYSKEFSFSELLKKAQKFCIYQERAVFQLEQKLKEWGASEETIVKVINILKTEAYINDERFVSLFVRSKLKQNKWGRNKIISALNFYKIDKDIMSKFAEFIDNELYLKILKDIIEKKLKELQKEKDLNMKYQKVFNFCKSKGFETDLINSKLKEIGYGIK